MAERQKLAKGVTTRPCTGSFIAALAGLSFLWPCMGSFTTMRFRHVVAMSSCLIPSSCHAVVLSILYVLALLAIAAMYRCKGRVGSIGDSAVVRVTTVLGAAGFIGHVILVSTPLWGAVAVPVTVAVVAGFAASVAFVMGHLFAWMRWAAGRAPSSVLVLAAASNAAGYVVQLVLNAIPGDILLWYLVFCPLGSALCYRAAARGSKMEAGFSPSRPFSGLPWRSAVPLVVLVYFEQAFTAILFTQHESWSRDYLWITLALCAAVWTVVLWYAWRDPEASAARFETVLLALFALFFMAALLVTILVPNNAVIAARCLVTAGTCLRILLWVVLVFAVGEGSTSVTVAWGAYVLLILAVPVSRLVEAAIAPIDRTVLDALVTPEHVIPVAGVTLFVVAAVFVGMSAVQANRLLRVAGEAAPAPPFETRVSNGVRLEEFACEHGLSAREIEVFELICRGYSARRIGERLSISESTVVSHTTHIYRKLGVSSKQELIELVERAQVSIGA